MKVLRQCSLFVIAACSLALLPATRAADVYSVKFSFTGAMQDENNGQPKIQSVKGTAANLLNIARGRAPSASIPTNEVLAAVLDCSSALGLIVYDKSAQSVLATIATPVEVQTVGDTRKGLGVIAADVATTGSAANSLDGGFLVFTGKAGLDTNGCPTKLSTAVTGVLDVTITDDIGKHSDHVLVMKGKLSLGKKLGTLTP